MLSPRIIPILLIHKGGLVKTKNFKNPKYVGDPLNAVKIFNEKRVDELVVLDIDATTFNKEPDFSLIERMARECRMPFCYGGGIKSLYEIEKIINLGVEKVAISHAAILNPDLISDAAKRIGSQSISIVLDIKTDGFIKKKYGLYTKNGTMAHKYKPLDFAILAEKLGAGEIIINSIDKDGTMSGYDYKLITEIASNINVPFTAIGGAATTTDIKTLIGTFGSIGAGAGSMFVFKGKYKAVLIQYPNIDEKKELLEHRINE